ncbi:hypothetical protein CGCSCA4_v004001 [Colletotrichum siamense]|uniref:DUF7371 domain-containing protein n=1 Tax=Colletotrichum siamense TaxID=690259 RepID=A0A9P5EYS2_COLSI|nr:hypothetical protein CGCSCA4_v004001 [Colletotrichum siamense]KAF4862524.1 hypothetical protein CGCSCA2_v003747 [Colletotrichum siamense]
MRARVIGGLAALGVALASTCPTLTQTVYIPVIAQPTSLPPTTITIDAYTPPAGGSQYTGPKPWESGPVITSTVYIAPTPDSSIASIPGNVDGNPPATTLPGGQVTPGAPGGNGQGTTVYTFPAGQTPPSFPWNPTEPGTNSDGVVVFSTTLYNTRPGSGGTPTVDALVTCFTVTFPSATDSGNTPGAPVGGGSVSTVVVPTMVPGPDGSLSYSLQTLLSSFPPGVGNGVPPATVVTTTYTMPANAQDPTAGTPVIATLTLTFPQPPATGVSQPPASPGAPGTSPSGPATITIIQPPGVPGSAPSDPATVTVIQPPGVPGSAPSGPATITVIQPNPSSPGISGPAVSVGPSTITVIQPSVSSPAGSIVTVFMTSDTPPAGGVPGGLGSILSQTVSPSDSIPGGYGDSSPSAGLPSAITVTLPAGSGSGSGSGSDSASQGPGNASPVTVTVPAGSGSDAGSGSQEPAGAAPVTVTVPAGSTPGSILGGYSDPAQATASPGPLGSPSVVTLWPTAQTDAAASAAPTDAATAVGSAQPGAASTSSCTSTLTPQPTPTAVSSMEPISAEPSSTETSSSLLTSTLVNVISEATTTYSFPFESLVTSISVITVSPADPGNAAGGSPPSASASTSASTSASASASVTVSAGGNVQSSLVLSTLVQVITTTPTATAGALERRAFLNATAPISAATPMCTGTTEVGTLSLDFDDLSVGPVYNPYHRFWFSKGFLVGPPPSDPYLPSSGGRLVEFVPPMLSNSNTSGFSGDTAQIGMGKTASSPCFQFDFYSMNLGCDSRIAGQLCEFTFTGYQWNATQSNETEFASQTAWVPSCPAMKECPLTVFKATGFSGLSSITVTLRVDGQPRTWWADDLLVGWSKNDCESAACRQQTGVDAVTIDNGPVWYWTSLGMRLLKPSRVSKHL